jgi:hypothetical protein
MGRGGGGCRSRAAACGAAEPRGPAQRELLAAPAAGAHPPVACAVAHQQRRRLPGERLPQVDEFHLAVLSAAVEAARLLRLKSQLVRAAAVLRQLARGHGGGAGGAGRQLAHAHLGAAGGPCQQARAVRWGTVCGCGRSRSCLIRLLLPACNARSRPAAACSAPARPRRR